ncbi:MAG: sulfite oxidase [Planctomycetota bacterium]|nr:sulfite oxidase [Planctomycetota bacterium]
MLEDSGALPEDLDRFDVIVSRRKFLGMAGGAVGLLAGLGAGTDAALRGLFGRGLIPVAWAQDADRGTDIPGKPGMIVHFPQPINGEFPPHLLDDDVTPSERHYVRNSGGVPTRAEKRDLQGWKLTVNGEVKTPLELSIDDLKALPAVTLSLVIECGGNGRSLFEPPVRGNPWGRGAVACSEWTGVRLRDVLRKAGLKESAVYTAHYGEDQPLGRAEPFSRGVPIDKAMEEHTIIAYRMNGKDVTTLNGFPVRLVVPGWVGSCSQKWLNRIWIRDKVHDSQKMRGYSYRIPAYPVAPGVRPPESDMKIATSFPIKSMITRPAANSEFRVGEKISVAGHAWAGDNEVSRVLLSTDYGVHWDEARLIPPRNTYAWARFEKEVTFERKGYYEIWARAFDDKDSAQPFRQPWNPKGYLGNVIHRLPLRVAV